MSILKVRLNKLSSDWHIARALLEDEYKAYIDKALNKIRTRYEFAAHLLDVHRMWCAECRHSGCLAVPVRSDRDTSAAGSAAARLNHVNQQHGQQAGLQSDAPDMGLHAGLLDNNGEDNNDDSKNNISETAFPLAMTCHGEDGELQADVNTATANERGVKQECHEDESSQEKDKDEEQREEGADEGWLDDSRHSNLQDQIPETHQHLADVQSQLDWTNHVSDLHVLIKQEGPSQERCNIDMDSSRNELTSQQRHEEGIPTQHIRSDLPCHLEWTNQVSDLLVKQEVASQEHCDVDMDSSRNQSTSHQGHEAVIPTQLIGSDGKTILENISEPSRSTHDRNRRSAEGSSQDPCDADGKIILDSNNEPSSSTLYYDERSPRSSSQDLCDAGLESNTNTQNASISDGKQSFECSNHSQRHSYMSACHKNLSPSTFQKPYQCSEYKQRFAQKGPVKSHMRIHTGDEPYQCSVCNKAFTRNIYLSRHMRLHTGDKPYQCPCCNKRFSQKSYLSRHVRTHTGDKPYQCFVCNKAFTNNSHLARHVRTHTGEKPYQCPICSKSFIQSGNVKRHMETHTGEKSYRCSVCEKTFTRNHQLLCHMRTHRKLALK